MTSFASLGLPVPVLHELKRQGLTSPFPIQEAAIPDALDGQDLLGRGPTGSGKTFTFGLPMLSRLAAEGHSRVGAPRGLVLAPTRELASQIAERLDPFAAALGLRLTVVYGGVKIGRQLKALAAPVDVLVATPGRLQDLLQQRAVTLDAVEITAIDEADHMADIGFLPQVRRLLDLTPNNGQRMLFSATLDGQVDKLVRQYLRNPVAHSTAPAASAVQTMTHLLYEVEDGSARNNAVISIAAREGKTILFTRTKRGVDRLVKKLRRVGINAAGLHGDKSQGGRERALAGFADASVPVLVATDIAARGIDIDDVSLVVHVDPPAEHKAYLHRAGRTARAGTEGAVLIMVLRDQRADVDALLRKADVTPHEIRGEAELAKMTGASTPPGTALPPFGASAQPPSARPRAQRSGSNHHSNRRKQRPRSRS